MSLKNVFQDIVSHPSLQKTSPITDFDVSYEGVVNGADVMVSYGTYMDRNDTVEELAIVVQRDNSAVGFDAEQLKHKSTDKVRFSAYEIEMDPLGMYEKSRTPIGASIQYTGDAMKLLQTAIQLADRTLSEQQMVRSIIREEVKNMVSENTSSYAAELEDRDYEVTPEERAAHQNFLKMLLPFLEDFDRILDYARRHGIFNDDEYEQLIKAKRLMKSAGVPMSFLNVKKSKGLDISNFDDLG